MKKDETCLDDHITAILHDPEKVREIMQSGIREALLKHKQAGNPICVWSDKDNKIVWIPPEKILADVL